MYFLNEQPANEGFTSLSVVGLQWHIVYLHGTDLIIRASGTSLEMHTLKTI